MTPPRRRATSALAVAGTLAILATTAGGAATAASAATGRAGGTHAALGAFTTVATATTPRGRAARRHHQAPRPYLALGDSVPFGYISGDGNAYRRPANFVGYPSSPDGGCTCGR